jgi:xanthine dehydrogenase small subunit
MKAGEMLTAVEIPKPLPQFVRFYKVAKRRLDDISTVAAAMSLDVDGVGRVRRARLAFGGIAATPIRVTEAEDAITDQPWNESAVARVQRILDRVLQPMSDHRGSKEYRLEVSKSLVEIYQWEMRASSPERPCPSPVSRFRTRARTVTSAATRCTWTIWPAGFPTFCMPGP